MVFFSCTKEDFSLIHAETSFLKPAKVASAAAFKAYSLAEKGGGREEKIKGQKLGEDRHHLILLCGRNYL